MLMSRRKRTTERALGIRRAADRLATRRATARMEAFRKARRRPGSFQRGVTLLGGAGLGAGLLYYLDPEVGRRRRSRLGDRLVRARDVASDRAVSTGRDLANHGQGLAAEAWGRLRRQEPTDEVLMARVRSKLGRLVSHPDAIDVIAYQGKVTLRGDVLKEEVDRLLSGLRIVRGVRDVDNQLSAHETAGDSPELQGTPRLQPDSGYWSPSRRVSGGFAGLAGVFFAARRGGVSGILLGLGSAILLARAMLNMPLKRILGVGAGRRAVTVQKSIRIDAPLEALYETWSKPENFPSFMDHVQEVRRIGDERYRWTASGPGGAPVTFDTEVTKSIRNDVIAWKTLPDAAVQHSGVVRFERDGAGGRIHVRMSYNPIAGAPGHVAAWLFAADPKHALGDDLARFKSLLEQGKTTAHSEEVRRSEGGAV